MCQFELNPEARADKKSVLSRISDSDTKDVLEFHHSFNEYRPTPLVTLSALAKELEVGEIFVKDESHRFDLNAFKILGASYGIYRFIQKNWESQKSEPFSFEKFHTEEFEAVTGKYTFCTASDGNHGRAVAWVARHTGQKAVIYLPSGTARARIENIEMEGAKAIVIEGTYDDAVEAAAVNAQEHGWQIISDTSYEGYTEIPGWIMGGYGTLFYEVDEATGASDSPAFDLVFLQSGVGALAAAAAQYYYTRYGKKRPRLVIVEPLSAACLLESFRSKNKARTICRGKLDSIMAGLNCGRPSLVAWPFIRQGIDLFLAINDGLVLEAMRKYYRPSGNDERVESGESGAAGLAGLMALCCGKELRNAKEQLGLSRDSRILLINTEGATDPQNFSRIVMDK